MRNSRGEKDVSVNTEGSVSVQNSLKTSFVFFYFFVKIIVFGFCE